MAKSLADLGSLLHEISSSAAGQQPAATKAAPPAAVPKNANAKAAPAPEVEAEVDLELERKYGLVRSVGEECVAESELRNLIRKKPNFVLYDGFEPSGRMHIAQGIYKAMNVNKCTAAGGTFVFWVADWFALMNDKMGGDLERIKTVGQYLIQVWTAAGMDMTRVKFLWSSEEICKHAQPYWTQARGVARPRGVAQLSQGAQPKRVARLRGAAKLRGAALRNRGWQPQAATACIPSCNRVRPRRWTLLASSAWLAS